MKKYLFLAIMPLLMMACSSSDDTQDVLSKSSYSINYGETVQIDGSGELTIENPFIVTFANGTITGKHIGQTYAVYNGSQKITITVNGTNRYLDYPVTEWGASASTVRSKHRGGSEIDSNNDVITYGIKSGTKIKYLYGYTFKDGKQSGAILYVPSTDVKSVVPWLQQKYYLTMTGDNTFFSGGCDAYDPDDAYVVVGTTLEKMNTSTYYSDYAYMFLFIPGGKAKTRSVISVASKQEIEEICRVMARKLRLAE